MAKTSHNKNFISQGFSNNTRSSGTGKSTAIAEIIWQHIRKNPKKEYCLLQKQI